MVSNFNFLEEYWSELAKIGELSERYLYTDPNTCLFKLGQFAEILVQYMLAYENISQPTNSTHANRIKELKKNDLLPNEIDNILYQLRRTRNDAVHNYYESQSEAQILMEHTYTLAVWFMQVYGDYEYEPIGYIKPTNKIQELKVLEEINRELELKVKNIEAQYAIIKSKYDKTKLKDRKRRSFALSNSIVLSEAQTRDIIDEQLRQAGWEADSVNLKYSKGSRPQKGRNIAISEWPTDSKLLSRTGRKGRGSVDYALFIGLELVGIIEAKKESVDIVSVIDGQCRDYASNIKKEHDEYVKYIYGEYKVPFLFATNGRKYFKELETKSGIWCLDVRKESNNPKPLKGWYSPENIEKILSIDIENANRKLSADKASYLIDEDGLSLRDYQLKAIEAIEKAIKEGKKEILISMATGTGKTRVALGLVYKLLSNQRFNRILFLVDRTTLGEQAYEKFSEVKIENFMNLCEIHNVKGLDDKEVEKETDIHIATVQSLVKRIIYGDVGSGKKHISVGDYDCIIVDEAHRGYILDKEMDDEEILYRNQLDYLSKYRQIIDYFDAVKIGLTATPALHTTEIFGKPVFNYSYRQAVIDGKLVDHDPPYIVHTDLNTNGIRYKKGENLAIYDPLTNEITNSEVLEDELKFDVETFNKKVITPEFNKIALEQIANLIDPEGEEKTIIFAVNDSHADTIVKTLRDIYEDYEINSKSIRKITGYIEGGNSKKIQQVIRAFKNEKYPTIAVTVDLLTTGVDIPKVTNLVFMRPVKSRILFEQMLGRATRLCPDIRKTHFNIIDAVFVYETLEPVTNMKPVVQKNSETVDVLINELDLVSEEKKKINIDKIIAKLHRKRDIVSKENVEKIKHETDGRDINQIINELKTINITKAIEKVQEYKEILEYIENIKDVNKRLKVYSDKKDSFIEITRGYGNCDKPEDYLESFKAYIEENKDTIPALISVCTKPSVLTRKDLRSLRMELDKHLFNEGTLRVAWKAAKNEDIAADIISYIRNVALDIPIEDHEARIKKAIKEIKKTYNFNKMQEKWIDRFEKTLILDYVLDMEVFKSGVYRTKGGFDKINKLFDNSLLDIINDINNKLYHVEGA